MKREFENLYSHDFLRAAACSPVVRVADPAANGAAMAELAAGVWAEMAADRGMIGIALTNTVRAGIPLFGKERLLGTNPICVAIPKGGETPLPA
jgi:hypothetical protein